MNRVLRRIMTPCLVAILSAALGLSTSGQEDLAGLEEQAMQAAARRVAASVVRLETLGGVEQFQGKLLGSGPTTGFGWQTEC